MKLLAPQDWTFPIPIAYGPGRLNEIAALCANAGMGHPLIITDRGSCNLPFIADTRRYLQEADMKSEVYADISPNPRDDEVAAGRDMYRQGNHDGIIAIGGGSGMDGAKAVCLVAANDLDLWAFDFDKSPPVMSAQPSFPPLITIPTTAGTGAETESTGMVTETARMMKLCVWHPELKPAVALLDPEVTVGLPASMTAWTGCDALVHAIEAYCVPTLHPMCDGIALEGLRLVNAWLRKAVHEPDNIEARSGMLIGSCLAGIAFLKGLGLVHAISHMVGAEYDTHHGLTNAVTLPAVLRFNAPEIADKVPAMAEAMGLSDTSFEDFHRAICVILDDLNIPVNLGDIGVPNGCATAIAAKAHQDGAAQTNPRTATVLDIQCIVEDALVIGR